MELYNKLIDETEKLLGKLITGKFAYVPGTSNKPDARNEIVLMRDTAFELGGSGKNAVNVTLVTGTDNIHGDEIIIAGHDLCDITADTDFARIAVIYSETMKDVQAQSLYLRLKKTDFVKYHVFLPGYMLRVSPESFREQVRVSRDAVKNALSFRDVGREYIKKYKENPDVSAVKIYFVTSPAADYAALSDIASKAGKITAALDNITGGLLTDCESCSFKTVCDEAEGMRELHFGKNKKE